MLLRMILMSSGPVHPNGKTKEHNTNDYGDFHYLPPFWEKVWMLNTINPMPSILKTIRIGKGRSLKK